MLYQRLFKQIFDLSISFIVLLVLAPILIVVTILLTIFNNGSPFFTQARPGKSEKIFKVIKFKTMSEHTDKEGNLLPDSERLTAIGKFLRKTSLDELPQLINVLKGDMSLIGPRPLLIQYLPLYNEKQKRRHEVKPGITGWAQVNGRNAITWEKKFEYDVWYVEHTSLLLDGKILLMTLRKIFIQEGINADGHATTTAFNGFN